MKTKKTFVLFGADATRAALGAVLCLALSIPAGLLAGCSSGGSDDESAPPPVSDEPVSVRVSESSGIMPCGGTLEAEYADAPSGCGIDKIVDRNSNTKFITGHSEFYLLWTGDESVDANYYSITSADDAPEADPKAWTLYGSDDNVAWKALDSRTGQIFAKRKEKKEYEFSADRAYKYLKLEIEDNGGAATTQIAELSIKHVDVNIDDLMHLSTSHTYDSTNPMGCNFTHLRAATAEDLKKLADPSIDPAPFDDFKYYDFSRRVVLYPSTGGRPSPADVNQHAVGDCCAVAVFASFAYLHPDFIKSIITDNHDGTYTVAMFDPKGNAIEVGVNSRFFADNNGNLHAVSGKNNIPCWSTVLEKAVMKWQWVFRGNSSVGGIATENTGCLFTGDGGSFAFDRGKLDNDQIKRAVDISLKQGKIVIGGFQPGDIPVDGTKTVAFHAYTFMFSPKSSSALFVMRNPWGGNPDVDGSADGLINIPNNRDIPPLIDLRILEPGAAMDKWTGAPGAYTPPAFSPAAMKMRVTPELMRSGR